jgi:RNA polymerase sigma-70 factor (ECF subfamily)
MGDRITSVAGPAPDDNAELMLRVRTGDEAAFRKIFERHFVQLVGYADRFFHNRAVAEEVVQEVFLRVYRARKRYRPSAKFTTWLYTIATRTCLNELRRGVYRKQHESIHNGHAPERQGTSGAEEQLEGRRLHRRVADILEGLPENQRAALILVRFEGQAYSQVAAILGVSESAVKSLVFRATDAVRRGLEDRQQEYWE